MYNRVVLSFLLFSLACLCQAQACLSDSALIPVDKKVRVGRLDNGLTYYIRYNNWPEKRACLAPFWNTCVLMAASISPAIVLR